MKKQFLGRRVNRQYVQKLLDVGNQFDLEKNGLFDARSGVVNIWCSPDDKPSCWNIEVTQGGLSHPREYVGALGWDNYDEADDTWELYIEATPYTLRDHKSPKDQWSGKWTAITDEEWDSLMKWVGEKANMLIRLAELHPTVVGTRCPFCDFVLPAGEILNILVDHVFQTHRIHIKSVTLGDPTVLETEKGVFPLRPVESFEE